MDAYLNTGGSSVLEGLKHDLLQELGKLQSLSIVATHKEMMVIYMSSIRNPCFYQTLADYTRHIRIV